MEALVIPEVSEELRNEAMAIPDEEVTKQKKHSEHVLADSTRVIVTGHEHEEECIKSGLKEGTVAEAKVKNSAYRALSARLDESGSKNKGDQAGYNKKMEEATTLRNEFFSGASHALRKNPEELQKLRDIKEGTGKEDFWYDFEKLAVLCENNHEAFAAIGFDLGKIAEARQMASELPEMYSQLQLDKQCETELCDLCNRVYTLLIPLVIEIRDCGKYAFRHNPEIQKQFNFSVGN